MLYSEEMTKFYPCVIIKCDERRERNMTNKKRRCRRGKKEEISCNDISAKVIDCFSKDKLLIFNP